MPPKDNRNFVSRALYKAHLSSYGSSLEGGEQWSRHFLPDSSFVFCFSCLFNEFNTCASFSIVAIRKLLGMSVKGVVLDEDLID